MSVWVPQDDGSYEYEAVSGYTLVVGYDDMSANWWAWACWGHPNNIFDAEIGTEYDYSHDAMRGAEEWLHRNEARDQEALEEELRLVHEMEAQEREAERRMEARQEQRYESDMLRWKKEGVY